MSPTLAEQGRRLLISNLDLRSVEDGTLTSGVQFFKLFPDSENFKLSTALRMNAAFPLCVAGRTLANQAAATQGD